MKLKVHYPFHKIPLTAPILRHVNLVYTFPKY